MKILFLGTPDFAVASLEAMVNAGYDVIGVVTQPDRPKGRGKKLVSTPVNLAAQKLNIPVYPFERIKMPENVAQMKALAPDLMVTAAYGQILSREILDIPRLGCINVHGSLLPAYRGAAPIQWAIINGEKVTGVTTMYTDAGVDTGDMLLKKEVEILPEETAGELFDRLAKVGAELLIDTLKCLEAGKLCPQKQDPSLASHYPMIKKPDAQIDWNNSADVLHNFARGMNPAPMAWTKLGGDVYKIAGMRKADGYEDRNAVPGTILVADGKQGLIVACTDGAMLIEQMLAPGGKWMGSREYLRGKQLPVGERFSLIRE